MKSLKELMPQIYFEVMDKEDFAEHEMYLNKIIDPDNHTKIFKQKGDIEEFVFYNFDLKRLKNKILKVVSSTKNNVLMYRVFPSREHDFILASFYEDLEFSSRRNEFNIPNTEDFRKIFIDKNNKITKYVDFGCKVDEAKKKTTLLLKCVNISHNTLISNIFETIERHELNCDYMELWQVKKSDKKIDVYYEIAIEISSLLPKEEIDSIGDDFERYIQCYIKPMSIFDLVGPAMVGPSSSHTAGANRIGQIARNIICAVEPSGEKIETVEVKLIGSFRDTGVGHKTPSALGGGLCGYVTDDPRMIEAGDPQSLSKNGIKFANCTAKFNGYKKGSADDDARYADQKNANIAEVIFKTDKGTHCVTGFSIGAGNVEIRFYDGMLDFALDGKIDTVLNGGKIEKINEKNANLPKIAKIYHENSATELPMMPFHTFEELIEYVNEEKINLIDLILDIERQLQNTDRKQVYDKMRSYWNIMQKSVDDGIRSNELTLLKLTGKDSKNINKYREGNKIFDNIYGKAVAYAVAVNEINAKSGVIIACPTAGSCGILPGVLKAYNEVHKPDEDRILESLMIAGFFGMILFGDVSTAGADYGCQAEIGSAAAMAAAALVYLEGGDVEQMIEGFTIAIKNSLGLICDPIAGLVEVPCVKRNGIYSSHAISAALMALSGVKSFVSPDEVVLTMREVGERLNVDYKETGKAGLAKTRDGKEVEKNFANEVKKFFN